MISERLSCLLFDFTLIKIYSNKETWKLFEWPMQASTFYLLLLDRVNTNVSGLLGWSVEGFVFKTRFAMYQLAFHVNKKYNLNDSTKSNPSREIP